MNEIVLFETFLKKRYQKKSLSFIENYFKNYSISVIGTLDQIFYQQDRIDDKDKKLANILIKDAELAADYILKYFPELIEEKKTLVEDLAQTKRKYVIQNMPENISLTDENEKVHFIKKISHKEMVHKLVSRNDDMMNLICFQKDLRDVLRYKYAEKSFESSNNL